MPHNELMQLIHPNIGFIQYLETYFATNNLTGYKNIPSLVAANIPLITSDCNAMNIEKQIKY